MTLVHRQLQPMLDAWSSIVQTLKSLSLYVRKVHHRLQWWILLGELCLQLVGLVHGHRICSRIRCRRVDQDWQRVVLHIMHNTAN